MCGDNDRVAVVACQSIQDVKYLLKIIRIVDILFTVCAEYEVFFFLEVEAIEYGGFLDFWCVELQNFPHRTAGADDLIWRQAFAEKVLARDLAVGEIDIRDVVDYAPVNFLGYAKIEAAVARFHVEDGNLAALGCYGCQGAVGVAQNENGFGLIGFERLVDLDDYISNRFSGCRARSVQEVIWFADFQFFKKYLVKFVIVVLPRMHKRVSTEKVELCNDAR